ncbi:MAG: protein kinase [Planctomycetia bacterium]|nr:protein kinase [Planctomycetia bacterium]
MPIEPHPVSPLAVHRDCPRCGKPVQPVDLVTECPHCGYEIRNPRPVPLSETVIGADPEDSVSSVSFETTPPVEFEPDPLIGTDLDVYRIDALLGRGGMGRVYLAHHRDLDRPCALKILPPELASLDADYVSRFKVEGQNAARVVHPNIITIHKIGADRGYHFLEMEFVPGRSLRQLIEDEVRLSPERATALAARISDALAEAHRHGIIHRDLKPDNVLMTLHGVPKLADFGLAKRVIRGSEADVPDGLCGTPQFMAPELYQGRISYFIMLAGRCPFHGDSLHAIMTAHLNDPVPNIRKIVPEVTLEMAECLGLMLDKNPANRPADGIQAAQLLQAILGHARDLDTLLGQAFRDDPRVSWAREGGQRFRLNVHLPGNRRQAVYVEPSAHGSAERLLLIYSTCCAAQPAYYETALKLNAEMPHGSVAIREIGGQSKFVVLDTYPRATVDAEEIRRSSHEVASRADAIEKLLTGLDRE